MKNNTLQEISQGLKGAHRIHIFPHISVDGDGLGSAVALCEGFRSEGKEAYIVVEDTVPQNLQFLDQGYIVPVERMEEDSSFSKEPDACIMVDCGEKNRIPLRWEYFLQGKQRFCLDHHLTSSFVGDFNYIDPQAAATGEIVFDLITTMGMKINKWMANSLFAAITTDTGNFQYSNTTKKTHKIISKLYDCGLEAHKVSQAIYENETKEKLHLHALMLDRMEYFAQGKAVISEVTQEMLEKSGGVMEDSDGMVGFLRKIQGVEIAAILKEQEENIIKVTMRAKSYANVSVIAQKYRGGGHVKAAGCTIEAPLKKAKQQIIKDIEEALWKE